MSMSASALKQKLITDMNGLTSNAWVTFGNTTGQYIQQNAQVTYGWVATGNNKQTGAPVPDPQTTVMSTAISGSTTISQPNDFDDFVSKLDTMIKGFSITVGDGTFSIAPGKFDGSTDITMSDMGNVDTFDGAMDKIATAIVNGVKKMLSSSPLSGTHQDVSQITNGFSGSATMSVIS
jgi:hypothetical protein